MLSPKIIITTAVVAAALLGLIAYRSAGPETQPTPTAATPPARASAAASAGPASGASSAAGNLAPSTAAPSTATSPPPPTTHEAIQDAIQDAAITYAPEGLPRIQPYLAHPDAAVREMALNGLVVLGEKGGAAMLREASRRLSDPREATKYLDTADYLELPRMTPEIMKSMKERKAAADQAKAAAAAPPLLARPPQAGAPGVRAQPAPNPRSK